MTPLTSKKKVAEKFVWKSLHFPSPSPSLALLSPSKCYLLMYPSPSPSQVWKSRLILSSSPVLDVSLLPLLTLTSTAAAAMISPSRKLHFSALTILFRVRSQRTHGSNIRSLSLCVAQAQRTMQTTLPAARAHSNPGTLSDHRGICRVYELDHCVENKNNRIWCLVRNIKH